jgi:hypothetical protein
MIPDRQAKKIGKKKPRAVAHISNHLPGESRNPPIRRSCGRKRGPGLRACEEIEKAWVGAVRLSRQPRRGFLRMTRIRNPIKGLRHGEERLKGASRTTHSIGAAPVCARDRFLHTLLRRDSDSPVSSLGSATPVASYKGGGRDREPDKTGGTGESHALVLRLGHMIHIIVMAGPVRLVPAIHAQRHGRCRFPWMPGTSLKKFGHDDFTGTLDHLNESDH